MKNIGKKELFPLSGISKKLTIFCKNNENNKFVSYKSDRYGFRNEDINWDKKVDFVLIGGSMVHGSCVTQDKTIDSQLSQISKNTTNKKINTINLGFAGDGPLLDYATLKEYLQYIEAKRVLYFFYEYYDFQYLQSEFKDLFLKKYKDDAFQQKLADKQPDIDRIAYNFLEKEAIKKNRGLYAFVKLEKLRSSLIRFLSEKLIKLKAQSFEPSEKIYQDYNDVLINMKKLTKNQNVELYFIYLPHISRFSSYDYDSNYEVYYKTISMVKNLDIKYIDLLNKFKFEHSNPLSMFLSKKGAHLNEAGYKFVAETIIKEINQIEKKN